MKKAKLFANGRSQAVRLPKEFRMPGNEVHIRREGDNIILSPIVEYRPKTLGEMAEYFRRTGPVSDEFVRAIEEEREARRHEGIRVWKLSE